ncbi:MAG: HNH endonuclease [Atopobiaceae bacterium]|nr:HNH endonuclease [Atopobiaceae bacterium]
MAKDFSRHIYHSRQWERARDDAWARDHGLCQECAKRGRVTAAEIVHHITELTPLNVGDPAIAYGLDNLECVCRECHSRLHGYTKGCTREGFAFDAYGNLMPV